MGGAGERDAIRRQWESATPGWASWEPTVVRWMEPATDAMFEMARVAEGHAVLDLACGAGSQTLTAAAIVGPTGRVLATDLAEPMLEHVRESASAVGLSNIDTMVGAAEDLDVPPGSFDAAICRLGLMLFVDPAKALASMHRALRPGGRVAVVVFTTPSNNDFFAAPMKVLLRHAGKQPPEPGRPGLFALGAPGVLEGLLTESGYTDVDARVLTVPFRTASSAEPLRFLQEAGGAFRAVIADSPEDVRAAAWSEVAEALRAFETDDGFAGPAEVIVAAGSKPA